MSHKIALLPGMAYSGFELSYTGNHTVTEIVFDGIKWQQWTFIGNGTLKVKGKVPTSKVWMCSGGGNGTDGYDKRGGLGAYAKQYDDVEVKGIIQVIIGSGATASGTSSGGTEFGIYKVDGVTMGKSISIQNGGGTGGGLAYQSSSSIGDGLSKYPFLDMVNFYARPHCAGAGAGGHVYADAVGGSFSAGGNGGSNGTGGGAYKTVNVIADSNGGSGGSFGGGKGSNSTSSGSSATMGSFYGAGSGGMHNYSFYTTRNIPTTQLPGYQGVAYLRIPLGAA